LFNGKKVKPFSHNLVVLNDEICKLEYLNYKLPNWTPEFLTYLTELGGFNRYLTTSSYNAPDAMHKLDELIWNVRRYCKYIVDSGLGIEGAKEMPGMKEAVINSINNPYYQDKPIDFRLINGELEKIIKRPHKDPARKALIWANLFYGKKNRKVVKFSSMSSSEIPPQDRDWFDNEANIEVISEYIKL